MSSHVETSTKLKDPICGGGTIDLVLYVGINWVVNTGGAPIYNVVFHTVKGFIDERID